MSSILKALKKLEDDKVARRPDDLKIDAEILRTDNSPRFSSAAVIIASLLLIAGGSGATYMYMKRDRTAEPAIRKTTAVSVQNSPPAPVAADIKTEQLPPAVVVVPAHQQKASKAETPRQRPEPKPTITVHVDPPKPLRPIEVVKSVEQEITPIMPPASHISPPTVTIKAVFPVLRVNGIAFNGGGPDSVAMVNGVPVSNGSIIEGVKIEEIYKNKVRFSQAGEKLEVPLGQSNR